MEQDIRSAMAATGLPSGEIDRLAPAAASAFRRAEEQLGHKVESLTAERTTSSNYKPNIVDCIQVTVSIDGILYDWADVATFEVA